MAEIRGLEGLTGDQITEDLERGARFVYYRFCVSILIITFRRSSSIYYLRLGEGGVGKGLAFSAMSFLFGWWGIPWGPIYTIQALFVNFTGGEDVTAEVLNTMDSEDTSS